MPYLPVRNRQLTHFMGGSIGPRMEICENSGLPILMVPRWHQSNGYIKSKLRVWTFQNCIALVGADTVLTRAGPQTTPFLRGQYRAQNRNMRNFGPTNPHGTAVQSSWYRVYTKTMVISEGSYGYGEFKNVLP